MTVLRRSFIYPLAFALASQSAMAAAPDPRGGEQAYRALYKELVETNSSYPNGSCTLVAQRLAARLKAAGYAETDYAIRIPEGHPEAGNLTATLPGSDPKLPALLLLAHIDAVAAKRSDWVRDPFTLVEEGGYFYGRGASDDKAQASIWADTVIRFKQEGYRPKRTIKLALTCGEEGGGFFNGVRWLLKDHPETLQAGWGLNEGGGGELDKDGRPVQHNVQAGEKVYQDFTLTATSPGGHSSAQVPHFNAIGWIGAALARVNAYDFPVDLVPATKGYFAASARLHPAPLSQAFAAIGAGTASADDYVAVSAANPKWNAILRTTCIPTLIQGGHAHNAQPQSVTANVNCRIIPGESADSVRDKLVTAIGDDRIKVEFANPPGRTYTPPPLTPQVIGPVKTLTEELWPGVPVVPVLLTGATDGAATNLAGIPTYGITGLFSDPDGGGIHGLNERIRVKSLLDGRVFLYRLVKAYTQ
jgi:acetylornithine deacetylase/succinyl-diaminopimelate desuccinylase-like protein